MEADYNIPAPTFEKQCNLYRRRQPALLPADGAEPVPGQPAVHRTEPVTRRPRSAAACWPGRSRSSTATLSQSGRNDCAGSATTRCRSTTTSGCAAALPLGQLHAFEAGGSSAGINDNYTNTYQQGLYFLDRPHVLKLTGSTNCRSAKASTSAPTRNEFVKKLISGWQWTNFFNDALKGFPSDLPGNVIQLKDPQTPGGGFNGSPDWKAYQVRLWNPCVLKQNERRQHRSDPGQHQARLRRGLQQQLGQLRVAPDTRRTTRSASRRTAPARSAGIMPFQLDASLLKTTKIGERARFQLGFEAFNLLNHNYFGRDNVNTTPDDSNGNFGTHLPGAASRPRTSCPARSRCASSSTGKVPQKFVAVKGRPGNGPPFLFGTPSPCAEPHTGI